MEKLNIKIIEDFLEPSTLKLAQKISRNLKIDNDYKNFLGKRSELVNRYFITKNSIDEHKVLAEKILSNYEKRNNVRIEICKDKNGFWLKPHNDHPERKKTILIYLDGDGPGTTFYSNEKFTVDFKINRAVEFNTVGLHTYDLSQIPHGVEKQIINGTRTTIILSFMDDNWSNKEVLYDT